MPKPTSRSGREARRRGIAVVIVRRSNEAADRIVEERRLNMTHFEGGALDEQAGAAVVAAGCSEDARY